MKLKKQIRFYNKAMSRTALNELIRRLIDRFGMMCTSHILDQLKTLGFHQATDASFSLGIDDLLAAPSKWWLVKEEDQQGFFSEKQNLSGNLHTVETLRQLMERWHTTSEYLKEEMYPKFQLTNSFNPVYMMSFSGARGNKSQVHQLLGIRGLMSDPQGKIVDLPIQGNFQEGLSLTEYIISSYGARKGVVDTAVRTADAGYLTRRLVEVVQHIIVRKTDCGTTQGIFISPIQDRDRSKENVFLQKITGRVLADDVYINRRCIATRNQDISAGLANQFKNLLIQAISIRTPFTCKSLSWICQLCYGRSLSHNNLIELGEAVGIIAGQSIGEPGTQLTLRTFHTGGVFTGNIVGTIRAPFNGRIQFNSNLVYSTRTFFGHPAFICRKKLFIIIDDGGDKVDYSLLPTKSWVFVQNHQYVESEQLIGEFRTTTSLLKEKVLKYIYSELNGEMHWSTFVCHALKHTQGNAHFTFGAVHLWILSGGIYNPKVVLSFPFPKDQDQVTIAFLSTKQKNCFDPSVNLLQSNSVSFQNPKLEEEKLEEEKLEEEPDQSSISVPIFLENFNIQGKKQINRVLVPFFYAPKRKTKRKKRKNYPNCILKIPRSGFLHRNTTFCIWNDSQYKSPSPGFLEYSDSPEKFVLIPEEVHFFEKSSPIAIQNKSIIRADTQITAKKKSQVGGLVQIHKKKTKLVVKILPGYIDFYRKKNKKYWYKTFVSPRQNLGEDFLSEKNYFQTLNKPHRKKSFVLLRTAVEYKIPNPKEIKVPFCPDLLREEDNLHIQMSNCFYGDGGKKLQKGIQLIQTCLIFNWEQIDSTESETSISITSIRIKNIVINTIQFSLRKHSDSAWSQKKNQISSKRTFPPVLDKTQSFSLSGKIQLPSNYTATFRSLNNEKNMFLILSTSDCFRIHLFQTKKNDNIQNKSNPNKPINNHFVGFFGHLHSIENLYPSSHFLNYNKILFNKFCYNFNIFEIPNCYILDEFQKVLIYPRINHLWNPKKMRYRRYSKNRYPTMNLGQLLWENFAICKNESFSESGQIIAVREESLVVRLAKPYLATPKATIHGNFAEIINQGDPLITFFYERFKSSDITQGLPKVEQLAEAQSNNPVVQNIEENFRIWNQDMTRTFGSFWGLFISTKITMEQGRIHFVDQIQKVYQSQGVHICEKHIELIIRQMTSRVLVSDDVIFNVFLPGELIGLSRAQRIDRAFDEAIHYKTKLLGITKASFDTPSFISEASFQETARVLAKAAIQGRIDWLKGLKENVILSNIIPAGTGKKTNYSLFARRRRRKQNTKTRKNNLFSLNEK
uniref:DNA-directed RNA polymerase subunit beta'' n=2 Tax=Welwitschia mirabilis TaxID=3377 RepID=RPOC2_WELMI|nr:RNA polymerase beta'' subunit [Welwitschia mirabilis]B2Y1V7.1 RecName: Full=DNA-directed RNA polymerase subunit beta''; AltName: Full=PEP; AltName: Full=Plastid-encoded RNA polymerase subunit beta''; Short=RNA polymerase subunit beta'' [Welwitschia mirabilis]ABY26787.1 RNA polymerase beta' subunit [Welwitschia mirabilis]AMA21022.1 RNA polymerase beta' subunit [Welwitschia mirabilis]BAH11231.1 RNA polymerase beta subunit-2 [Welwitschia mirabilis]